MDYRMEHDLLGELAVPNQVYYGIHTLRAAENFSVSGNPVHPELIKALGVVKQAAAEANMMLGRLDKSVGRAICQAAAEVAQGELNEQFIVDVFQGGAGTSTHMNVNEVIANRAIEILGGTKGDYRVVHPLDHVNLSQSTNDVYPTALHIAAIRLALPLTEAAAYLQEALQEKAAEFAGVLKVGRTQLQDAVPVTLGQEFAAYAQAVSRDHRRLQKAKKRLRQVNLGGTAVGTSINADKQYIATVIERLRSLTGLELDPYENLIDGTQNADVFVEVSGLIKTSATSLLKISGDLRLMGSGPRAGLGEIRLPELQAGSSIMPGKVNPVMTEMVSQVSYQIIAQDLAVTLAAQAGQLELNAFLPLVSANLLPALDTLAKTKMMFADKCIRGITVNLCRCREEVLNSTSILTVLAAKIGYEKATELAHQAIEAGVPAKDVVLQSGLISEDELEALLAMDNAVKGENHIH
ncbi:aspartate ammonia-lyase [Dethiobacter alkaliphilus]|uniref:aspartate ammonia-lyase n=1 Tax=Dethiobacter alkaliphilus TaxID=427926 RepID=UPI002227B1AA|nr:aspartate ammonia-lyase [Dethiobacter alkaliphilus]MCW3490146.1 aspartate ammonia-lyase [Dethiobacter alkaliphilus]